MSAALIVALCFTGALLVTTAYVIMGSVPLLPLEHDTPKDSRFVRGFFNLYYAAATFTASATAVSYAVAGRVAFAAGAAALAVLATPLRRKVIPKMDSLGAQIGAGATSAVSAFRDRAIGLECNFPAGCAIGIGCTQTLAAHWESALLAAHGRRSISAAHA